MKPVESMFCEASFSTKKVLESSQQICASFPASRNYTYYVNMQIMYRTSLPNISCSRLLALAHLKRSVAQGHLYTLESPRCSSFKKALNFTNAVAILKRKASTSWVESYLMFRTGSLVAVRACLSQVAAVKDAQGCYSSETDLAKPSPCWM